MSSNLHWILTHPFSFLEMAGRTLWIMRNEYLSEFVGKLGWLSIPLPTWLIWTFIGTLILVAASSAKFELGVRLRLLFVLLGVVSVIAGFVWVWTLDTQTARIESLRTIAGFQGRYLIPAAFPLLAAISGSWLRASRSWAAPIALFVVLLANGIALHAVGRTYYSEASSNAYDGSPLSRFWLARFEVHGKPTKYEHKLIRRPGPTAEDGKVYFVSNGLKRWVLHAEWMAANGFTWGDVLVLPSEELNAIPTGQPIGWP